MLIASYIALEGGLHCNELKTPYVEKRSTRVPFCVRSWSQSHWPSKIDALGVRMCCNNTKGVVWETFHCVQTCCLSTEVYQKNMTPSIPRNRCSVPAKPEIHDMNADWYLKHHCYVFFNKWLFVNLGRDIKKLKSFYIPANQQYVYTGEWVSAKTVEWCEWDNCNTLFWSLSWTT